MTLSYEITAEVEQTAIAEVVDALRAFNAGDVGPAETTPLAVLVRDGDNVIAGLVGFTAWGWLYTQKLWVSERARGQGLADAMLLRAETEAIARGCHGAWIDTFSPVALGVYKKAGYTPFGTLDDFPKGRSRTFLQKRLAQ